MEALDEAQSCSPSSLFLSIVFLRIFTTLLNYLEIQRLFARDKSLKCYCFFGSVCVFGSVCMFFRECQCNLGCLCFFGVLMFLLTVVLLWSSWESLDYLCFLGVFEFLRSVSVSHENDCCLPRYCVLPKSERRCYHRQELRRVVFCWGNEYHCSSFIFLRSFEYKHHIVFQ